MLYDFLTQSIVQKLTASAKLKPWLKPLWYARGKVITNSPAHWLVRKIWSPPRQVTFHHYYCHVHQFNICYFYRSMFLYTTFFYRHYLTAVFSYTLLTLLYFLHLSLYSCVSNIEFTAYVVINSLFSVTLCAAVRRAKTLMFNREDVKVSRSPAHRCSSVCWGSLW